MLMAMRWVSLLKAIMPVGGPRSWKVANAVTKVGKALLMIELETLVTKAYRLINARIMTFREFEKLRGSAGSGDGLYNYSSEGHLGLTAVNATYSGFRWIWFSSTS